ncbi:MAG: lysophospholipid acyltransferase family protein [Pseudomonadota bacterium]
MILRHIIFAITRFLVGGSPIWQGSAPAAGPRIYFANHGSHLDTILMCAAIPPEFRAVTHPVAAADYWGKNALTRYISLRVLHAVLVDRKASRNPLEPLREVLQRGESLIIFPEGTRRDDALPGKLKSGIFHLAREFPDAELIPVYLENLSRAYPKGAILPAPISCSVTFGAPLVRVEGEQKAVFLDRARDSIIALAEHAA